jgi:uncharacterized protein (DUF885 family)
MKAVAATLMLGVLLSSSGCTTHPPDTASAVVAADAAVSPDDAFAALSREFLEWYYANHPVRATSLGVHRYDGKLPDFSRDGIRRRADELDRWLERLATIEREDLDGDAYYDHPVLDHAMRAQLLDLREIEGWRRNPMVYNRAVADGAALLIDRQFAPLEERLLDLTSRMEQVAGLLSAARANLDDVPRLWAELALRDARGTSTFLARTVPDALREQGVGEVEARLAARWERARERAVEQLDRFGVWLSDELLPRANGDFRLGRELFERKLLYEEHFSLSADELRSLNEEAIERYRRWVEEEARRIDPAGTPAEVMRAVAERFPEPDELIATAERDVLQARDFVVHNEIVTLPSDLLPTVRPTPAYARSGFASMSTPGPFETVATEAYYNITNVDPDWTEEQKHQHLTYFNYAGLLGISIHEAMPGHFVQLLFRQQVPTDVRKVFTPNSLVEGWAHYTEQMMIDEGLGDGDAAIRLGQLRRALQRHARWEVGLSMHAFGEPLEQAAERFEEIAYFSPFPALRETQRGTYNPTYLYYALGRMEIFRLREDYRAWLERRGERFELREFHDRLLRLGLPLPLAREALMPGDGQRHSGSGSTPSPSAKRS